MAIRARQTALLFLFGSLLPLPAQAGGGQEGAASVTPQALLERALANVNTDRRERIRLTNLAGRNQDVREVDVWLKRDDDGYRVLGTFRRPGDVRGTSFLVLPASGSGAERASSNQYFVYLPALKKLRRISGAQRGDAFFGTNLSQGDVEPHPASDYHILWMRSAAYEGEPVHVLRLAPRFDGGYDNVVFTVAQQDAAILRMTQLEEGRPRPVREILARREWLESVGTHVLPGRMLVLDGRRGERTQVEFLERQVTSDIPESYFSTSHLLRRGR
jgi:hypothetical protein